MLTTPKKSSFYYDISMPEKDTVAAEHYDELKVCSIGMSVVAIVRKEGLTASRLLPLQALVNAVIRQKQPFERLVLTKDQALALFAYNKYKTEIIQSKVRLRFVRQAKYIVAKFSNLKVMQWKCPYFPGVANY